MKENIEIVSKPNLEDIIIDVRHPNETEETPLRLNTYIILCIPFFKIAERIKDLDPKKKYLIYCEKGIMSRLYANILRDKGFCYVGIFKPEEPLS